MLHSSLDHIGASHNPYHFRIDLHYRDGLCSQISAHRSYGWSSNVRRTGPRGHHRSLLRNSERHPFRGTPLLLDAPTGPATQTSRRRAQERLHSSHPRNGRTPRHHSPVRTRQPTKPAHDPSHGINAAKRQLAYGSWLTTSNIRLRDRPATSTSKDDDSARAAGEHIHLRTPPGIRFRNERLRNHRCAVRGVRAKDTKVLRTKDPD